MAYQALTNGEGMDISRGKIDSNFLNAAEKDFSNVTNEDFATKAAAAGLADDADKANVNLDNVTIADFAAKAAAAGLADDADKANVNLDNVTNTDFALKATSAGVGGVEMYTYTATLTTTWTGSSAPWTQTLSIPGILVSDDPIIDVELSTTLSTALLQEDAFSCVSRITTASNSITAYCNRTKPTTAIPLKIKVVR